MRVIITGGTGFIGQLVARDIARRGSLQTHQVAGGEGETKVTEIVLADVTRPAKLMFDELSAARVVVGDVADAAFCRSLFEGVTDAVSVFHLGAVMSGQGEKDFDLVMGVNLHGTLNMLEAARACGAPRPRFIMASAGATLGSGAPTDFVTKDDTVGDWTRATPHTSYGMTKACAELLLSDYSRRGFVDGRACRLPSVVVRAGAPNAATTSVFSSVVREPLAGKDTESAIGPDVRHAVTGHRTAVACLVGLHELAAAKVDEVLGFDRTVFIPSIAVSLAELQAAVRTVVDAASHAALGRVTYVEDAALSAAVGSFPTKVDCSRAVALGLAADLDAEALVRQYCDDFPDAIAPGIALRPAASSSSASAAAAAAAAAAAGHAGARSVALVTGGGTGIGRAVALRLARGWVAKPDGAAAAPAVVLVLTGRRVGPLEEAAEAARAAGAAEVIVVAADLTVEADVAALFSAIERRCGGRLDLLFNNAGCNVPPTPFGELELPAWRKVLDTNLGAAFHVAREAYRLMARQQPQGGRIINNGSVSAQVPRPGAAAYTCSKMAMSGLTRSIALDGRAHSIAAGQIDFGNVVSDISAGMASGMPQADGSLRPEPRMEAVDAAETVHCMAALPLNANVLQMTVMATNMPLVGRG